MFTTMKKTYIIPSTIVMSIQATQMLALSAQPDEKPAVGSDDNGVTMGAHEYQDWDIWGDAE